MTDKPRMGRPPTGIRYPRKLSVPISDDQGAWLDTEATRRQITVAELIRTLIEQERTP